MRVRRRPQRGIAAVALLALFTSLPLLQAQAVSLFSDGFESGLVPPWTASASFTRQNTLVHSGSWAGRATGTAAYAYESLASTQSNVYFDSFIRVVSNAGGTPVLRFRDSGGTNLTSINITIAGALQRKIDIVTGQDKTSGTVVTQNVWHELQLHAQINGISSVYEVWLDGTKVNDISGTVSMGTAPVGRVQLGRQAGSTAYDIVFDDAAADTAFIGGGGGCTTPPAPTNLHQTSPPTANQVNIAWNASAGATGYNVYRSPGPNPGSVGNTTSFQDNGVAPSTQYNYQVSATDGACESPLSTPPLGQLTPAGGGGGGDKVITAAGDIACDPADTYFNGGNGTSTRCRQKATATLLTGDAVLPLGDEQYECGGGTAFTQSYGPTWGAASATKVHPTVGNHEYDTSGGTGCGTNAAGYFGYFGGAAGDPTKGYYSWNLGSWHFIALNSECAQLPKGTGVDGCDQGSPQDSWLETDLAGNTQPCILAYWHQPLFASNGAAPLTKYKAFWADLYAAHADLVLNGHRHFYERFGTQDQNGAAKSDGIREFIVGTGGKSHGGLKTPLAANSEKGDSKTFGVLKLTLHANSYDWQFVPIAGSSFTDSSSSSVACH